MDLEDFKAQPAARPVEMHLQPRSRLLQADGFPWKTAIFRVNRTGLQIFINFVTIVGVVDKHRLPVVMWQCPHDERTSETPRSLTTDGGKVITSRIFVQCK